MLLCKTMQRKNICVPSAGWELLCELSCVEVNTKSRLVQGLFLAAEQGFLKMWGHLLSHELEGKTCNVQEWSEIYDEVFV